MQLRITAAIAGEGWAYSVGQVIETNDKHGQSLIAAGYAEPVASTDLVETAEAKRDPAETATVKTTRAKRKSRPAGAVQS